MTALTEHMLIRAARAIDAYNDAQDYVQAADQSVGTPDSAAKACWDAASLARQVAQMFETLADSTTFQARRYEKADREEKATGREYRGGSGEAA